jgi:hypothetical protein
MYLDDIEAEGIGCTILFNIFLKWTYAFSFF